MTASQPAPERRTSIPLREIGRDLAHVGDASHIRMVIDGLRAPVSAASCEPVLVKIAVCEPVTVREELTRDLKQKTEVSIPTLWKRVREIRGEQPERGAAYLASAPENGIEIRPGELHRAMRQAETLLLQAGDPTDPPLYQRSGELVRIAHLNEPSRPRAGVEVAAGTPTIVPVSEPWIRGRLEREAVFFARRGKEYRRVACPADLSKLYLASVGEWKVPVLTGIARAPVMRSDGTIAGAEGYDEATGLLLYFGGATFPPVPQSPSIDHAREAIRQLLMPVQLYPWADRASRSVWLSAVLTMIVRPMLPTAPLFVIDAPVRGSGKTLLAQAASVIGTGSMPAVCMDTPSEDEQRKRLFALLRAGCSVALLDDIEGQLGGAPLCAVLTSPAIEDRVLGHSRTATVSTAATFLATGNNLAVRGDLVRRVLVCRVDPACEHPDRRRFAFDPVERARELRPALVTAALTVLRAHVLAGWPGDRDLDPYGSFGDWSRLVRGALVWAGEEDPCLSRERVSEADDGDAALGAFLAAWAECFDARPTTAAELVAEVGPVRDALAVLIDLEAKSPARSLGRLLERSRDVSV